MMQLLAQWLLLALLALQLIEWFQEDVAHESAEKRLAEVLGTMTMAGLMLCLYWLSGALSRIVGASG